MNVISNGVNTPIVTLTYILLHDKYPVLQELLQCIRAQLVDLRWVLDEGKAYTARQLCGDPLWVPFDTPERKLAGSCISHMVRRGELPLVKVTEPGHYPNKYELSE